MANKQQGAADYYPPPAPTSQTSDNQVTLDDLRVPTPDVSLASAKKATVGPSPIAAEAAAAEGSTSSAAGTSASATGYNAQTGEIDSSMLSAGRLEEMTGKDSPLMRRAAQEGMLMAGKRGLENSSFAAGASTGAMVDRAAPLAMQDAQTTFANMRANIDAENRAQEISTGRTTDVSLANAQLAQQVEMFNADAANQMETLNAQLETAVNQQNADAINAIQQQMADIQSRTEQLNAELETQTNLSNSTAQNAAEMQAHAASSELNRQWLAGTQAIDLETIRGQYQQLIATNQAASVMYNSYLNGMTNIMSNRDITPSRVSQYLNVMSQQLEGGLEFLDALNVLDLEGGALDVPGSTSSSTYGDMGSDVINPEAGSSTPWTPPPDDPDAVPPPTADPYTPTNYPWDEW